MVCVTLIPTQRNDGSAVSQAESDGILRRLWQQFGGLAIEGTVTGHWIDSQDGQHYADASLRVSVECDRGRLAEAETAVRTSAGN
jgi:hypothetical protein